MQKVATSWTVQISQSRYRYYTHRRTVTESMFSLKNFRQRLVCQCTAREGGATSNDRYPWEVWDWQWDQRYSCGHSLTKNTLRGGRGGMGEGVGRVGRMLVLWNFTWTTCGNPSRKRNIPSKELLLRSLIHYSSVLNWSRRSIKRLKCHIFQSIIVSLSLITVNDKQTSDHHHFHLSQHMESR
jgi:hypothetical protein